MLRNPRPAATAILLAVTSKDWQACAAFISGNVAWTIYFFIMVSPLSEIIEEN
jgi:hypothetical protein